MGELHVEIVRQQKLLNSPIDQGQIGSAKMIENVRVLVFLGDV